jgi:hypothetical protein
MTLTRVNPGSTSAITGASRLQERTPVYISACDPLSRDGLANQLRGQQVELVDKDRFGDEDVVAVVVVDEIDQRAGHEMRTLRRAGVRHLVVVAARVDGKLLADGHDTVSVGQR